MSTARRYPRGVRERAVRLVFEHEQDYDSQTRGLRGATFGQNRPRHPILLRCRRVPTTRHANGPVSNDQNLWIGPRPGDVKGRTFPRKIS
jgi:hypothetical protein